MSDTTEIRKTRPLYPVNVLPDRPYAPLAVVRHRVTSGQYAPSSEDVAEHLMAWLFLTDIARFA